MPNFRLFHALLVAAITLSGPVTAATRPRAIHPERDKMSADARRDAVLADLEAILIGPADQTSLASRPYLSSRDGLCRRDVITISYRPKNVEKSDGALKPEGVSVASQYHWVGYPDTKTHIQWQKTCDQLSVTKVYWVRSPNDITAEDALVGLDRAFVGIQQHQGFKVVCKWLEGDSAAATLPDCTSAFLRATASVSSADRCSGPPDNLTDCSDLELEGYSATIATKYPRSSKESGSIMITMAAADVVLY